MTTPARVEPSPEPAPAGTRFYHFFNVHPEIFVIYASGYVRHVMAAEWASYGAPWDKVYSITNEGDFAAFKAKAFASEAKDPNA